ncbi:Uncharacterized protein BSL78_21517 [Apostichopus japonicus]|uniref:Uncharacterized protein n=1 Tax=Stichopus japonicus TaxID=307972 RepID=A0A2G8K0V1_STIJA|nr:Uncharacterized protein BSL78_21517 [Apostichopus japonicus]
MEKEFLVKFKEHQKIITIKETDDIVKIIQETFEIEQTEMILQNYDKEWDDWIDVSNFGQIPNRTVLRCIIPKALSTVTTLETTVNPTPEPPDNDSLNDTDTTEILESDDSSTGSEELIVGSTLSSLKGKWPDKFVIPEKRFSDNLKVALNTQKTLLWSQKRELMDVIANELIKYTDSPSKVQRKQIALELITKYKHLKEVLGSGTDGWEERIRDKMKNVRRLGRAKDASSPSSSGARKRSIAQSSLATQNQKAKRGEVNWSPIIPDGEDDKTLKEHTEVMKKEFKKNTPNVDLIKERMEITYAQRRKLINSKPLIIEVQENYPALFSPCEIGNEFKRLTDTELHKTFESSLSKAASKILSEVKLKPQLLPIVMKHLQLEDKTVAALLVLPVVFGNESFFKLYEEETSRDYVVDAQKMRIHLLQLLGT